MADLQITKALTGNKYTVSPEIINVTTIEDALIEDFGEPIVTLGGTIDVTATSIPLTGVITGTFTIGETVTAELPTYSGATGTLQWVDTVAGIIYVEDTTGVFLVTDIVTGQTSDATCDVSPGGVGVAITQFEARYDLAPQSTENFTAPLTTRRIPSGWEDGALVITFDGNTRTEAEENALDFIQTLTILTTEKWQELVSRVDNFEEVVVIAM